MKDVPDELSMKKDPVKARKKATERDLKGRQAKAKHEALLKERKAEQLAKRKAALKAQQHRTAEAKLRKEAHAEWKAKYKAGEVSKELRPVRVKKVGDKDIIITKRDVKAMKKTKATTGKDAKVKAKETLEKYGYEIGESYYQKLYKEGKALMSNPNKDLGNWILRDIL
ncbi:MAG: hypothetical protein GY793_05800 [Proteobacteria bacterium]|nr:hypothetical protein [Pseudomonadota bacterium]